METRRYHWCSCINRRNLNGYYRWYGALKIFSLLLKSLIFCLCFFVVLGLSELFSPHIPLIKMKENVTFKFLCPCFCFHSVFLQPYSAVGCSKYEISLQKLQTAWLFLTFQFIFHSSTGLAAPAIAAGFSALAPTLGTIIPVIGASGFAAAASAAGTVAGSVAIAASFGGETTVTFFGLLASGILVSFY